MGKGFVVSDYDAWANLKDTHHMAATYEEAAALGINNGMDQESPPAPSLSQP